MARKKNVELTKKRTKTILLNKHSFLIYEKLRADPKFNFSKMVNDKLLEIGGTDEDILSNYLFELQKERDLVEQEYAQEITNIANQLKDLREKRVDPFLINHQNTKTL